MHQGARALPAAIAAQLISLFEAGRWTELERAAGNVTQRYPRHILGWRALGKSKLALGKMQDAIAVLSSAVKFAPAEADIHNDLGSALSGSARTSEAEASFRRAIALNTRAAEPHVNLGALLLGAGRHQEAAACYQQALAIDPGSAVAHNNLGNLSRQIGDLGGAEASYRKALALRPDYTEAWVNLGSALADLARFDEAIASYRQAERLNPDFVPALAALGRTLVRLASDDAEAARCLMRALALAPDDAAIHVDLGNVFMRQNQKDRALAMFRRAQALQPLLTRSAAGGKPKFSAVFLDTPLAGSTPLDYLAGTADYDRHFFCVMPGSGNHDEMLRAKGDVIFNMICNVDDGAPVLQLALELVARLGRPVVNHPRLVMQTDRQTVARRIAAAVPGCITPGTIRVTGAQLAEAASRAGLDGFRLPLLVRFAGTHGGDDFYKFDDWPSIAAHVSSNPNAGYYATEYADYRSADGFFRKYRFIFIDGEILPYHLAIHDDWKVHHFRTDMANQAWMRQEEARFLDDMGSTFDVAHRGALCAMGHAVELDYCGIDCGLDQNGRLVMFECNASMLVHDEKTPAFAYKNEAIGRIKSAFESMLARRCSSR